MSEGVKPEVLALAESWASIEGKLDAFRRESHGEIHLADPDWTGHFIGYVEEAQEMIRRLERRGFTVRPCLPFDTPTKV